MSHCNMCVMSLNMATADWELSKYGLQIHGHNHSGSSVIILCIFYLRQVLAIVLLDKTHFTYP